MCDGHKMLEYILVTPVKNEEEFLPRVSESIIAQSEKPLLWIIVDDGSADGTPQIIHELENQYNWITSIRLPPHPRDITFHYSYVCKKGFDQVLEQSKTNLTQYSYIGLIDADTILEENYFEKLEKEFNNNSRLGIASGNITDMPNKEINWSEIQKEGPDKPLPRGSGRLWRKECFFEIGGYLVEPSPDSISNVKAKLRGWEIRRFGHIHAIQLRNTSSAEGLWKGNKINGTMAHYLNKHPILVVLNFFDFLTKKPYYPAFAYALGYIKCVYSRSPKISDPEIRDYYWNDRIKEYL